MPYSISDYQESASYLSSLLHGFTPEILIILGSGLGFMAEDVLDPVIISYSDIPHFRASTAPGHAGRLIFGRLEGKSAAVMQGRIHYYEGASMEEICFPVRVLRLLGVKTLIATNAAGCINASWNAGDLMLITDHIKLCSDSPLRGPNLSAFGTRFPDSTTLYTAALLQHARAAANETGVCLREGIYMYFTGPQYETPAEIRVARTLGADAAGMSTVPEAIAAHHCGMQVLAFSMLTNMAAGITGNPLSEQEVLAAAEAGKDQFSRLIRACLRRI